MILLSATGTLDTVLVLLIVWQILRLVVRAQERAEARNVGSAQAPQNMRPKGEVRIERTDNARSTSHGAHVQDADFEEIN